MTKRTRGLGASMSKIFGASSINENIEKEENDLKEMVVNINLLQPNVNQPRKVFDEDKIKELADSIKKFGLLQPIIVKKENSYYNIMAGERRFRASKLAGLTEVPVRIMDYDEKTTKEIALIENLQRENLNFIEEANAYQNLIDEFGYSQEELSKRVSKSRSAITNTMRLLKLDKNIIELIKDNKITEGHARSLLSIDDENERNEIVKRIIEEKLSVRDVENISKVRKKNKIKLTQEKIDNFSTIRIFIKDIEEKLKNKLNTKVKIIPKDENQGKIEIEYYSKEDLDAIYTIINSHNIK